MTTPFMTKVDLSGKSAPDNKVVATENINLVCNSIVIIHIDVDTLNLCFSFIVNKSIFVTFD